MGEPGKRVIIIDTSAFVAGFDPFSIAEAEYTVPMVREEIFGNSMASIKFKLAEESGRLVIREPEEKFLEKVKESATSVGDAFFLSEPDLHVLALALQLKTEGCSPLVATDDYSIQNVADRLGMKFVSLGTLGIRKQLRWIRYCPACRKQYPAGYESSVCEVCGTKLKRKPLRSASRDVGG